MSRDFVSVIVGVVIVAVTAALCITYYGIKRDDAIKSNIESAIVKGIDPVSVRCAYDNNGSMCVVYAATHNKEVQLSSGNKK